MASLPPNTWHTEALGNNKVQQQIVTCHQSVHLFERHLLAGAVWFTCSFHLMEKKRFSHVFFDWKTWGFYFAARSDLLRMPALISPPLSSRPLPPTSQRSFLHLLPLLRLRLLLAAAPPPCNCCNCQSRRVRACVCVCSCRAGVTALRAPYERWFNRLEGSKSTWLAKSSVQASRNLTSSSKCLISFLSPRWLLIGSHTSVTPSDK